MDNLFPHTPVADMGQYIRNTFSAAKDSMSINGMDAREMEAEVAKAQEGEGRMRFCQRCGLDLLTGCRD